MLDLGILDWTTVTRLLELLLQLTFLCLYLTASAKLSFQGKATVNLVELIESGLKLLKALTFSCQ